jgi:hypothetical protein
MARVGRGAGVRAGRCARVPTVAWAAGGRRNIGVPGDAQPAVA